MFFKLLLAFTLIPLAEITVLIWLGGVLGLVNTIAIVILTALAGAYLARMEGTRILLQIRTNMNQGIMPTDELIEALIIFVAGAVLLTPGFLTDIAGLGFLFPPTRRIFRQWLTSRFAHTLKNGPMTRDHY